MEIRYIIFSFVFLLLIIGCEGKPLLLEEELPPRMATFREHVSLLPPIHPLDVDLFSFQEIVGWYDDDHILYITDESGYSTVRKHHLYSGTNEELFSLADPIVEIVPSADYQWFAIQTIPILFETDLYFINREGEVFFEWILSGIDVEVFWNPYKSGEALLGVLHDDFTTSAELINIPQQSSRLYKSIPSYIQWLSEDTIGYLDWSDHSLSFEAPIIKWKLTDSSGAAENEGNDTLIEKEVVLFLGLRDSKYLTITVHDMTILSSRFDIYDMNNNISSISWIVPGINMYSGNWWIPSFSVGNDHFYYIEPNETSNIDDESTIFTLIAMNFFDGKKRELMVIEEGASISISPNETWMLMGYHLDTIWSPKYKHRWDLLNF